MAYNDLIDIQEKINTHKENLAENLTNKSVEADATETLTDLIEKVKTVKGKLVYRTVPGSLERQDILPTEGNDGLSKVTVLPVLYIPNLIPENVKNGVTIYNVTGTYEGEGVPYKSTDKIIGLPYTEFAIDKLRNGEVPGLKCKGRTIYESAYPYYETYTGETQVSQYDTYFYFSYGSNYVGLMNDIAVDFGYDDQFIYELNNYNSSPLVIKSEFEDCKIVLIFYRVDDFFSVQIEDTYDQSGFFQPVLISGIFQ